MALSDPIPVRFTAKADDGLALISLKTGMSKAELIRIAVDEFIARVEQSREIVFRVYLDGSPPPRHLAPTPHINEHPDTGPAPPVVGRKDAQYSKRKPKGH
jgi:hypothetical protein